MLKVIKSHFVKALAELMQSNWFCEAIKHIVCSFEATKLMVFSYFVPHLIYWWYIDVNMRCYTFISSNRYAVCVSGSISPQSQPLSRHSCWLPFWGTADICLLSPSDTLLGMGLWHFWLCVSACVYACGCVCDELLGHAPMTFYCMLMVFIAMAAGGEAVTAVCV